MGYLPPGDMKAKTEFKLAPTDGRFHSDEAITYTDREEAKAALREVHDFYELPEGTYKLRQRFVTEWFDA